MLAVFTVDTAADSGAGSLRNAIAQANSLAGPDEIVFAASLSGATIVVNGPRLEVQDDLVIDATALANGLTIDNRTLGISFGVTTDAEVRGLTFTGRSATGSAIANSGVLVIDSCTFVENVRGAIANTGTVTVSHSLFHRNAGGVASALQNDGRTTIVDSTFAENGRSFHASDPELPVIVTSQGAGRSLTIERSTIGGNEEIYDDDGQGQSIRLNFFTGQILPGMTRVVINNSIVFGEVYAPVQAKHSLLADVDAAFVAGAGNVLNVNPQLGPLADNGGPTPSYALMPGSPALDAGDPDFLAAPGMTDQRGGLYQRLVGQLDMGAYEAQAAVTATPGDFNADGRVDAGDYTVWRNNYGASVGPLGPGDATGDGLVDHDDYVAWRDHYGFVPLGATIVVNHLGDGDDGDIYNGRTTLREAIRYSVFESWANTITFDPSLSGGVLEVGTEYQTDPYWRRYYQIERDLTIDARMLPEGITLDAGGESEVFYIRVFEELASSDFDVTLAGLTLINGKGTFRGAAISGLTTGKLTVIDCDIFDCFNGTRGGAVYAHGNVELIDTTIDGSVSGTDGAAVYVEGNVSLTRTVIRNVGDATRKNRGVAHFGSPVSGGIWNDFLVDSEISGTTGGGISVLGNVVLERSRIENNQGPGLQATRLGSGSGSVGGNVTLVDSVVSNHTSEFGVPFFAGGSIIQAGTGVNAAGNVTLTRSQVENNRVLNSNEARGGGVMAFGRLTAIDSSISGNKAAIGGGIYARGFPLDGPANPSDKIVTLVGSTVNENEARRGGAAIHSRGSVKIDTSSVSGNRLVNEFVPSSLNAVVMLEVNAGAFTLTIADSVLANNSAPEEFDARVTRSNLGSTTTTEIVRSHVIDNEMDGVTASRVVDSFVARNEGVGVLGTQLEVIRSTISGNRNAIVADRLRLQDSTVRGNRASVSLGTFGPAAAIVGNSVLVERSLIAENGVTFEESFFTYSASGGIRATQAVIVDSTIRDNTVTGPGARGGGVNTLNLQMYGSTVSGNTAIGAGAQGGGIWSPSSPRLRQSTVSGNRAEGAGALGGGVWGANLDAMQVTIVGNAVVGDGAEGGGVYVDSVSRLIGGVLANNTATAGAPDLRAENVDPVESLFGVAYSLVRDPAGSPLATGGGGAGNLFGVDPLLGPLANNGGRTWTHLPLVGSPLVDAGDPSLTAIQFVVNVPPFPGYFIPGTYDQRGEPFNRAVDRGSGTVRIDIGAVEVQAPAAAATKFGAGGLATLPSDSNSAVPTPAEVAVDEALATATADDLLLIVRLKSLVAGEMASFDNLGSPFEVGESDGDESLAALIGVAGLSAVDDDPLAE